MSQNPPPARRIATETQALNALSVNQARFRRLVRLGLLSPAAGGGFEIDELRRQYAAVEELERRVAAISGDILTPAERNGALAFLIEAARPSGNTDPTVLCLRVASVFVFLNECSSGAMAP